MRKFKMAASVLLAVIMVITMSVTAFADTTYTITVNNPVGTYEAYQIFAGDLATKDGNKILSNITWGSGVSAAGQEALQTSYEVSSAKELAARLSTDAHAKALAKALNDGSGYLGSSSGTYSNGSITGLAPGYYMIRNAAGSVTGDNVYTDFIVEVVGDVSVSPKGDKPEVQKKVKDINDSTGTTSDWQDSADYDIGDTVPYQLKATLQTIEGYSNGYAIEFVDAISSGLTFKEITAVTIDGTATSNYTVGDDTINEKGETVKHISLSNLIASGAHNNSVVIVEYTATLNNNAVIGSAGNPNEVYLKYSNNPNGSTFGETNKDKVIVFTYRLTVNKIDSNNQALKGAAFELFKKVGNDYVSKGELKGTDLTTFAWKGIDDGDYKIVETQTPDGYNSIDDQYFTVSADHDILSDNPALNSISGAKADGSIIVFETETGNGGVKTGIKSNIVNQSGTILPSTGGIGTTIFYVGGGILVVGAALLLITRRRMHKEQ